MNNSKKGITIIILLLIILIGIIGIGTIKERYNNKKDSEEYETSLSISDETGSENEEEEEEDVLDSSKVDGFFEKLRAKQDVKVLMLGDEIAMSKGRTSDNGVWSEGVKNLIERNYGSKAALELAAQENATTASGLTKIQNTDISSYDLIILCYGYADNNAGVKVEDVKNNYKSIINKIMKENSNATIIVVLESMLPINNPYRAAINEIATSNSLIIADMKNAFVSSGLKESSLANKGLPNDRGYQVYTQTIEKRIKESMG